jgi:tetratricopeptide (TPR) repeat protein/tRNA A-37 threonylcarbamoyl transferase component Bud32
MPAQVGDVLSAGDRLGRYRILEKIGEGGMGEVYLAYDKSLDRRVAVKILNQKYNSSESNIRRFLQEAKAASALNHPNILVIHEIGETAGTRYIVSELVEGQTLREILVDRRLSLTEVLEIAIQTAGALAAAHGAGIVHRDIKPENVMVRPDGYVKVLDFGLAKLLPKQVIGLEDNTIKQSQTAQGMILGTVSYMSPEQARGSGVDGRTDIFSLGIVLYEMLSGRTPFAGDSNWDTLANLINKEPPPLERPAGVIPPELGSTVSKMLRKDPDERYREMKELIPELKKLSERLSARELPADAYSAKTEKFPASIPAATGDTNHQTAATGPAAHVRRRWPLPALAALAVIAVAAAAFYIWYFRNPANVQTAVKTRSPAYDLYIRGRVKADSDNREDVEGAIKLLEQAVATDPNYAEAYASLARAYTTKAFQFAPGPERKQVYENAEVAAAMAFQLDPNSAEAHFARAIVLWTPIKRFPHEQAIQAFKRAIELDPNLDEAHQRLGMVYLHIGLFEQAEREIKKAIEINPNNTLARFRIGSVYAYEGKYEDAIEVFKTVPSDVSPALISRNMADALVHLGRLKEAEALADDYLKEYPTDEGGNVTSVKAILLAKAGKQQEAEETIRRAIEIGTGYGHFHHTAYNIASAYAIMNDRDQALKWLQDTADDGFPNYTYFERDSNLDNLRSDHRFVEFMTKLKAQMEKYKALE